MCGSATHPGGGHHGRPRQAGGSGNPEGLQGGSLRGGRKKHCEPRCRNHRRLQRGGVTAFYLAKAGYKPLVLERRAQPGGAAITEEFHPGFRCFYLAHSAGPLWPVIVRDMQLEKHGLQPLRLRSAVTSLSPYGRALILYRDCGKKAAQEMCRVLPEGRDKDCQFQYIAGQDGPGHRQSPHPCPPGHRQPQFRRFRACSIPDARFASWASATCTVFCERGRWRWRIWYRNISKPSCFEPRSPPEEFSGRSRPLSAGSSLVLLIRAAGDRSTRRLFLVRGWRYRRHHPGDGLCRKAGGSGNPHRRGSHRDSREGWRRHGVVLSNGEEITAKAVVSNADPSARC